MDFGSASPVWFGWRDYSLLASGAKEGVLYILDADALGGRDHQTPLLEGVKLGNDPQDLTSPGIWGGLSTWQDDDGRRWLYVPLYGPPSKSAPPFPIAPGPTPDGSVMAFEIAVPADSGRPELRPGWISRNFKVPEPVVLENGENVNQRDSIEERRTRNNAPAVLHALDARTGAALYHSRRAIESWVHFSGMAIAQGQIYVVDYNSVLYCFGLEGE